MVNKHRWYKAQKTELEFWRAEAKSPRYFGLDGISHTPVDEMLRPFDLNSEKIASLSPSVIIEVGCGPYGLIHYLDTPALRVGLDPLTLEVESAGLKNRRGVQRLQAVGEHIPISANSAELVICYNVLDHMADPAAACVEIARVLRKGGILLFELHVFPQWIGLPGAFILGLVDTPHPFHFTVRQVKDLLLGAGLGIETFRLHRRNAWRISIRDLWTRDGVRHLGSNILESVVYIRARKPYQ